MTFGQFVLERIRRCHLKAETDIGLEQWMEAWFDVLDAEIAVDMGRAAFRGPTKEDISAVLGPGGALLLVKILSQGRVNPCEMALIEETMNETIRLRQYVQARYSSGLGQDEFEHLMDRLRRVDRGPRR